MTRSKTPSPKAPKKAMASKQRLAQYRLSSLLHTVRCIAQHEDRLCGLLHDVERAGHVSPEVHKELSELLDEQPCQEYTRDLAATRDSLSWSAPKGVKTALDGGRASGIARSSRTVLKAPRRK